MLINNQGQSHQSESKISFGLKYLTQVKSVNSSG